MPQPQVPKLADYGTALQANQSMMDGFNKLGSISQNYLNYDAQQKQNAFSNQHQTDVLNETKNQNKIANKNADRSFEYTKGRDDVKDGQWYADYTERQNSTAFDQNYKTNVFNHTVEQDNISNGLRRDQLNKPDYATFNSVDANGNPTLSMINKNNGSVINTGQQVYNEAKKLAPEQSMYYIDRANEMKQKQSTEMEKQLTSSPSYIGLSEKDQNSAINYLRQNGKMPNIGYSNSWGGGGSGLTGKGYYFNGTPMSEAVQKERASTPEIQNNTQQPSKPTLEEVGKQIDSLGSISTSPSYYNRNSRDLIKAKEWADGAGADYLRHIWNPTDKTKLEYYNLYGNKQGN